MSTVYEWDIETVDEHGDIVDHDHRDTCPHRSELGERQTLVLVRDQWRDGECISRHHAYVEDGQLPETFTTCATRVPKRFHEEFKLKY